MVVVVVTHEVLDGIVGQQLLELVGKLCGKCLVVGKYQGRSLNLLNQPGRGGRFTGSGCTEKNNVSLAVFESLGEFGYCLGLVASGNVVADDLESV